MGFRVPGADGFAAAFAGSLWTNVAAADKRGFSETVAARCRQIPGNALARGKRRAFSALPFALATCVGAVSAQTPLPTVAADGPAAMSSASLDEIVVTTQKRAENSQLVPVSVIAFTAGQLAEAGVTSTSELDIVTPGLVSASQGGYAQPHLRGIGTTANGPSVENPIALYVDGVYYSSMSASTLALNNIDSVEVDRGPQGTLFGRNATGGLIQITTRDPTREISGHASIGYGNYQTGNANFYVTGGVSEHVAADVSLNVVNQWQGYGRNAYTGQDVNQTQDLAFRSKWLYTIGPVSQLKLAFDFENTKFVPAYIPAAGTIPLGGPSYTGPTQGMDGYTQPSGLERQGGASVELTQQLSGIEFKSLTAFRRAHLDASIDGGLVTDPAYVLNIGIVDDHLQLTEELQLLSDTSSFIKWDTGAYFFYAEGRYDPVNVTGGLLAPLSSTKTWSHQTAASVAGFGQVTIAVLPKTDFTAGIRYTAEQRRYAGVSILNGFDGAPVAPPSTDVERATFRQPTWRLSLEHRFSDPMLGYVSYNRGFKSGGFNDDLVPTTRYAPETLDAFEIGSKTEWFGKRLRLDIATFLYDYKNIQAVTYPAGLEEIYNGAAARLYGLDLDLAAAVTRHLTLRCGVEVLRSRFSSFPDADFTTPVVGGGTNFGVFDAARHRLPIAPDWVADTSAEYAVQTGVGKLTVSASFGYNNGWYAEPDNRLKQPAYGLLNASVSWSSRDGVYGIRLWGKNLANSQYVVALASQSNGDFAQYAPPRTFGIVFTQSL